MLFVDVLGMFFASLNRKLNNEQIYDTKYIASATVKM